MQVFAFVCVCAANEVLYGSPTGLITLVLNSGKYLSLMYCIILSSSGKSQRSSQVAPTMPTGARNGDPPLQGLYLFSRGLEPVEHLDKSGLTGVKLPT